jgi:beta-glucosidase
VGSTETEDDAHDFAGALDGLSLEQQPALLIGSSPWTLPDEPSIGLCRIVASDGPAGVRE